MVSVMNISAQFVESSGYTQFDGQSDGFFRCHNEFRKANDDDYELILLPENHGLDYNYPADNVPLEQGLLLLSAFGLLYVIKKDND